MKDDELNQKFNINSDLFNSISELIKEPFLIIDQTGNIIVWNKEAARLFNRELDSKNIFDLLDSSASEKILASINKVLAASCSTSEQISLFTGTGLLKLNYSLSLYTEDKTNFLFCLFKEQNNYLTKETDFIDFVPSGELLDESEHEIVDFVTAEAPFTLTGLEKIRKFLSRKESAVWLENCEGSFVLISKKYEQLFNFENSRVEGIPVSDFLLPVIHTFWTGINELILKNGTAVKINKVSFNGITLSDKQECIKIPLLNADGKIFGILGIVKDKPSKQHSEQEKVVNTDAQTFERESFIGNLPLPSLFIASNEILEYNELFVSLFLPDAELNNKAIKADTVFTTDFLETIKNFQSGREFTRELKLSAEKLFGQNKNARFDVYLNKVIKNNLLEGIFLLIHEEKSADDLGILIGKRGLMFDILIEKNPEPVFIYDTENLSFLEVNEPALKLYGYSKEEFLQMDLTDLYTPEDIQTLLDSTVSKEHFGKFIGPFRHRKKDGSSVFVEISKVNFKFNDKEAHFNTIKDITEVLELQKKNQIYKSAFDNSSSMVFLTDNTGFITFANKDAFQNLDSTKKKLLNSSFTSFVKDDQRGKVNTAIFQNNEPGPFKVSASLKSEDDNYIDVFIDASPIKDYKGKIESFIIVANYASEAGVKEVIKEVVKEVIKEVPSDGNVFAGSVSSSDFDKNLLSGMFHEILTPINVIIGFIQELAENSENLSEEQKEAMDIINQNRKTLLNSMNSIVEFVDLEKTKYHLDITSISITEILDSIQKELETVSRDGVDLAYGKISSSLRFENDKGKLVQLFTQLIKMISRLNQNKKVYFSASQNEDDTFVVSIKDSYSSVSPELFKPIRNIFENDQTGRDFGLSKLSIKLVKTLLTLLHGRFEIFSNDTDKPDYGFVFKQSFDVEFKAAKIIPESEKTEPKISTDFEEVPSSKVIFSKIDILNSLEEVDEETPANEVIEIPVAKPAQVPQFGRRLNLKDYSCLYIEDQIDSQILFKVQMKELKDIKFAVSFEDALPLLDNNQFDFIVMDINLQGEYNGLDALKIIHKMPMYQNIPIIAVTAYVLPGDKEKFIATGFHDFISKPIFREKMVDSLENIFLKRI